MAWFGVKAQDLAGLGLLGLKYYTIKLEEVFMVDGSAPGS